MSKKTLRTVLFLATVLGLLAFFVVINAFLSKRRQGAFEPIGDSNHYAYQIEDVSTDGNELVVKGWFFELKKIQNQEYEVGNTPFAIIIYDLSNEKETYTDGSREIRNGLKTDVVYTDRPDINEYFKCEYDYTHCGFEARIDKSKFNLTNGNYQIIIKPDDDEVRGIQAAFIVNGKLKYIYPFDEISLNVDGTDLEKIVKDGICVVSYPEVHMCVYQYEWKLYWIAEKEYEFEKDGSTQIEYFSETTQFDKIPEYRTKNGRYWDSMFAPFENYEITESMDCGEYRVCVRDIPIDYSITQMGTGYRLNNKWLWKRNFRPVYKLREN